MATSNYSAHVIKTEQPRDISSLIDHVNNVFLYVINEITEKVL